MDYLTEKLKDPEWRRLFEEETAKLDKQFIPKVCQRKVNDPWWKNTLIGVLASPYNIYKK